MCIIIPRSFCRVCLLQLCMQCLCYADELLTLETDNRNKTALCAVLPVPKFPQVKGQLQPEAKAQLGAQKDLGNAHGEEFILPCKTAKYFYWIIRKSFYFLLCIK